VSRTPPAHWCWPPTADASASATSSRAASLPYREALRDRRARSRRTATRAGASPKPVMKAVGVLGGLAGMLTAGPPADPHQCELMDAMAPMDHSKAVRDVGWSPATSTTRSTSPSSSFCAAAANGGADGDVSWFVSPPDPRVGGMSSKSTSEANTRSRCPPTHNITPRLTLEGPQPSRC